MIVMTEATKRMASPSRRRMLLEAGAALCAVPRLQAYAAAGACNRPSTALRDILLGTGVPADFFNGHVTGGGRDRYLFELQRTFRIIVPENAGKMWNFRPASDVFSWSDIDPVVAWAERHHIALKFHALLYDVESKRPQWYRALSPEDRYRALEIHVRTTVRRYAGKFSRWDVVNEPLTTSEADYFGTGRPRLEVLARAFKWVREEDSNGILVLNDQVPIEDASKATRLVELVNNLRTLGAPVQVVGLQSHFYDSVVPNTEEVEAFIRRISCATGLPVDVTEFDVTPDGRPDWPARQAELYRRAIEAFIGSGVVKTIIMWGFQDSTHWKPGAGIFDTEFRKKPAYNSIVPLLPYQ